MVLKDKRNLIFISIVLVLFLATFYLQVHKEEKGGAYLLPLTIGQWQGLDMQYDRDLLASWLGHPEITFRNYRNESKGYNVSVYIAYYKNLEASDKAHAPDVCYPGQGWQVVSDENTALDLQRKETRIRRMDVRKGSEHQVVYSWWQTSRRIIPYNSWYHLYQIFNKITFRDTAAIWVRISSDTTDGNTGEEAVKAFCRDAAPMFDNYFRQRG